MIDDKLNISLTNFQDDKITRFDLLKVIAYEINKANIKILEEILDSGNMPQYYARFKLAQLKAGQTPEPKCCDYCGLQSCNGICKAEEGKGEGV